MRNHVAVCGTSLTQQIAFVAALASVAANAHEVQLMPVGDFRAIDGRPGNGRNWHLDRAAAEALIKGFNTRVNDLAIDYEHQTLRANDNGQPAPAAGWIKALEWREGKGLFAKVEWTERAKAMIAAGEYRYISPVFYYDKQTLVPTGLAPAALVNYPAIDGMQEVALSALAEKFHPQENSMNPLLAALIAALGLTEATKPEDATTAVATLKTKAGEADALKTKVAELEPKAAKAAELETSIAALKAGAPDPAKYVPIAAMTELQTKVAALTNAGQDREVDELVKQGLKDGKIMPSMEKWARDLGKQGVAQLKGYLDTAAPIAALATMQTQGRQPNATVAGKDALAIAKAAKELMDTEAKAGRVMSSSDAVNRVTAAASV